jgi:collagenase-like PrtC family protease
MEVVPKELAKMYRNACMLPYDIHVSSPLYSEEEMEKIAREKISGKRQHIWSLVHIDSRPCGACALPEFEEMGIESVKIVGRGNSTTKKITDVRFIRTLLDLLEREKLSREEYRKVAKNLYQNTYGLPCRIYACYYPSAGFPDETKLTVV